MRVNRFGPLVILAILFLSVSSLFAQEKSSDIVKKNVKKDDQLSRAVELIQSGKLDEAEALLKDLISKMPAGWSAVKDLPEAKEVAFWSHEEFLGCSFKLGESAKKKIVWAWPSYSYAYHLLAYIEVERNNPDKALQYLDQALLLEPDRPDILCEKAYTLVKMKKFQEAYDLYEKAKDIRSWASDKQRAKALRGMGSVLIDLGRLDEAEARFKESLKLEPENKIAQNELDYIIKVRKDNPNH
jgi:tetratricopeptide (TPR) repeat protein